MRRALNFVMFLLLAAEPAGGYCEKMSTPVGWLSFLTNSTPLKLSLAEMFYLAAAFMGGRAAKANRAKPMDQAIKASLITITVWWAYGIASGGLVKPTYTQLHSWMLGLTFGIALSNFNHTPKDFLALGKTIFAAVMYRSFAAIAVYMLYVRNTTFTPALMTTHGDTVLFVTGLMLAICYAVEFKNGHGTRLLLLAVPIILLAIQLNNRRLAWASLGGSLPIMYFVFPKTTVRRRINRVLMIVAPIILIYVGVGWGKTQGIFKPLASFSSMGGGKVDASTKARDNENVGLITMVQEHPVIGTGWGHEWKELDTTFTVPVSVFPMYHYQPHNTVIAMLAFSGFVGFAGTWMVFPVALFLNARTYRFGRHPVVRVGATVGSATVLICANQMFGDMGFADPTVANILAATVAVAIRFPVLSGAWPGLSKPKKRPSIAAPRPARV